MRELDDTNRQLISLLRKDARMSVAELAKRLSVSRATVQNRMQKLADEGVVLGYTVRLGTELTEAPIRAFMSIQANSSDEESVIARLRGHPNVRRVHHTTGRWDLIAEIHTDTLQAFNKVVGAIRLIKGVKQTESNLLLESYD